MKEWKRTQLQTCVLFYIPERIFYRVKLGFIQVFQTNVPVSFQDKIFISNDTYEYTAQIQGKSHTFLYNELKQTTDMSSQLRKFR